MIRDGYEKCRPKDLLMQSRYDRNREDSFSYCFVQTPFFSPAISTNPALAFCAFYSLAYSGLQSEYVGRKEIRPYEAGAGGNNNMEGIQLRNFRLNMGMSLRAFGKQVGLSGERIRVLETRSCISPHIQERICTAFKVDGADPLFFMQAAENEKKTETARTEEWQALKRERAAYLRNLRMELGVSQKDFADAIGVNLTKFSGWERDNHLISDKSMERIENAVPAISYRVPGKKGAGRRGGAFISVYKGGLRFSRAVMNRLGGSGYVKVYYKEEEKLLAIMAAEKGETGAQRLQQTKQQSKLSKVYMRKLAEKLLGFEVGKEACRVWGTWTMDDEYEFWMFDMSKAERDKG